MRWRRIILMALSNDYVIRIVEHMGGAMLKRRMMGMLNPRYWGMRTLDRVTPVLRDGALISRILRRWGQRNGAERGLVIGLTLLT